MAAEAGETVAKVLEQPVLRKYSRMLNGSTDFDEPRIAKMVRIDMEAKNICYTWLKPQVAKSLRERTMELESVLCMYWDTHTILFTTSIDYQCVKMLFQIKIGNQCSKENNKEACKY